MMGVRSARISKANVPIQFYLALQTQLLLLRASKEDTHTYLSYHYATCQLFLNLPMLKQQLLQWRCETQQC